MQMTNPTFLLIGLENGHFAGWNLTTNSLDYLPAHEGANAEIIKLEKHELSSKLRDYL